MFIFIDTSSFIYIYIYIIIKYAVETFYVKENSSGSLVLLQGSEEPSEKVHQVTLMDRWVTCWMDRWIEG
jgi:hypothetical protein